MLLNAKQGQNKKVILELVSTLKPRIEKMVEIDLVNSLESAFRKVCTSR
jgi:hypothetical protein